MSAADEAWEAHRGLSDLWLDKQEAFIRGFEAGARRALEDAAKDATDLLSANIVAGDRLAKERREHLHEINRWESDWRELNEAIQRVRAEIADRDKHGLDDIPHAVVLRLLSVDPRETKD